LVLSSSSALSADAAPLLKSDFVCEATKKVVLCVAPLSSTPGSRITYAELHLLKAPSFLRAVTTESSFSEEKALRPKLKLIFMPSGAGTGEIVAQLQGVVCLNNGQACPHIKRSLVAQVRVPP
jgi:hypothetical protein